MVSSGCKEPDTRTGPAVVRTPNGLGVREWEKGLQVYAQQAEKMAAAQAK